jgi:hypothetical protein
MELHVAHMRVVANSYRAVRAEKSKLAVVDARTLSNEYFVALSLVPEFAMFQTAVFAQVQFNTFTAELEFSDAASNLFNDIHSNRI